eukprot:RCo008012
MNAFEATSSPVVGLNLIPEVAITEDEPPSEAYEGVAEAESSGTEGGLKIPTRPPRLQPKEKLLPPGSRHGRLPPLLPVQRPTADPSSGCGGHPSMLPVLPSLSSSDSAAAPSVRSTLGPGDAELTRRSSCCSAWTP